LNGMENSSPNTKEAEFLKSMGNTLQSIKETGSSFGTANTYRDTKETEFSKFMDRCLS